MAKDNGIVKTARAKLIIIPNAEQNDEVIFHGFGADEHEASDQAQKEAFVAGWRHDNCSGWMTATNIWYGRPTISGPYQLWGIKGQRPPYETAHTGLN